METSPALLTEIKKFNKNVERLNRNLESFRLEAVRKPQQEEAWGTYEDANKILARSKTWYKEQRLGYINQFDLLVPPTLLKGRDWKAVGRRRTEYRLQAIWELKERLTQIN